MPPAGTSTKYSVESFQAQYGSLWRTCEHYLDGTMPEEQRRGVELVVDIGWVKAVADTRLTHAIFEHTAAMVKRDAATV